MKKLFHSFILLFVILPLLNIYSVFACEAVPQLVMDTVQAKKVTLVGEFHGTVETPQAFYNLVCNVMDQNKDELLTVGLELSSVPNIELTDQASLEKWLAADEEWVAPHDGRSSQAMYQLLQRLVQDKQSHPNLSILLFNVPTGKVEPLMAKKIINAYNGQRMLILTGNFHAKLKQTNEPDFANAPAPMGHYIYSKYPHQTTNIYITYNGSTQWAREGDTFGVFAVGKSKSTAPHQARLLSAAETEMTGYQTIWNVGEAHASYPQIHTEKDDNPHMPHLQN
ncbi:hypothetical protein [Shewanella sp.]|uniref:hypothetical protein n=1 Tax=Shewanella sp. TaxID=50422 RepID=UPI003D11EF8D